MQVIVRMRIRGEKGEGKQNNTASVVVIASVTAVAIALGWKMPPL